MGFTIHHLHGHAEDDPPIAAVRALLDELAESDDEHTDVSIADDRGWTLGAFGSGLLVWEDVAAGGEARHLPAVPRAEAGRLFVALAEGRRDEVDAQPWRAGRGS